MIKYIKASKTPDFICQLKHVLSKMTTNYEIQFLQFGCQLELRGFFFKCIKHTYNVVITECKPQG